MAKKSYDHLPMEFEQYDPDDTIFYCKNDKAWRRKNGCSYRIKKKMDDCSRICKQAIKEGISMPSILNRRK